MNRCNICNKSSIIIIECKCYNKYCLKHASPEFHSCKSIGKFKDEAIKKLEKDLVKVEADRLLERIT